MPPDLRLLAILDPSVLDGRDLLTAALAAEAGGATAVQLRLKGAQAGALYAAARSLLARLAVPLYVNDRADVAWVAKAHGVHVGQDDVPAAALRSFLPPPFRIGVSVGSPAEARAVSGGGAAVDYWSLGPVYRTPTKADAGVPLGVAGFTTLARLAPAGIPVIGIGGISAENAGAVIRAGAGGVAVISAIFGADDMELAARRIRDAVDGASV